MTAEKLFNEWINKQDFWLKSLYESVAIGQGITDEVLKNIIDCYVQKSFRDIVLTVGEQNSQSITLRKLFAVQGVNRLIPNQEIVFGRNLTVVYGENGTGKTGYSRIIQQIGKYIGEVKPIKPNVFDDKVEPKAKIEYAFADGAPHVLEWSASERSQLNIKLFNSACVHFSLNSERKIDFTPHIFYTCEQLASATSKLSSLVSQRLDEFSKNAVAPVVEGTKIRNQVEEVITSRAMIDLEKLDKTISQLKLDELETQKGKLEQERDSLSTAALLAEEKRLSSLQQLVKQVSETITQSEFYKKKEFITFVQNQGKIKDLQSKTVVSDILSQLCVQEPLREPLIKFIKEADELYRLSIGDKQGISSMQKCLLCGHEIADEDVRTKRLLQLYENLLIASDADSIERLLKQNQRIDQNRIKITQGIDTLLKTPGVNENATLKNIVSELLVLMPTFEKDTFESELNRELERLHAYCETVNSQIAKVRLLISQSDEQRKKIDLEWNEVFAQIDILKNWEQERAYLLSYINLSVLKGINNHGIAKCQKDIQEKIYKESFVALLQATLDELNAPSEVKFNTAISSSKMAIKQGYDKVTKENQLSDILSEGEQTVVALAQFIAESKFNPEEKVLFFDDPVNSLDLERMQVIANALIGLAKEKQIVIFTHNLVFLGFIKAAVDKEKTLSDYKFYQTERTVLEEGIYVGLLTETANPNVENYKFYVDEIGKQLRMSEKTPLSLATIKTLYGYLRSAIELLISEKMFKGTIERYRADISVMRFSRIKIDDIKLDQEPLTDLYEKVCRYIDGHSSSPYAKMDPTVAELKDDYAALVQIAKKY